MRLFGREYSIKGHGNKRYIQRLANSFKNELKQFSDILERRFDPGLGRSDVLNITDELFKYKQVKEQTIREWRKKPTGS